MGFRCLAGGIVLLLAVPIVGSLWRFPARNLIVFGFVVFAAGYAFTALHLNRGISFGYCVVAARGTGGGDSIRLYFGDDNWRIS